MGTISLQINIWLIKMYCDVFFSMNYKFVQFQIWKDIITNRLFSRTDPSKSFNFLKKHKAPKQILFKTSFRKACGYFFMFSMLNLVLYIYHQVYYLKK